MSIFSLFGKSSTLYFPDNLTFYKYTEYFELYQRIFAKLGINVKLLERYNSCGIQASEAGYESDSRDIIKKNFEIFKQQEIESILTNSPEAYKFFSVDYPNVLPEWNIEVINMWRLILEKLIRKPRIIKNKPMESITFHDSCYLGRYSGIYDEPRQILEAIGYEVKEMEDNREESMCCGSCGNLPITNPELSEKIAKQRILQAKRIGVKKLVTASVQNYRLLKKASYNTDIEVLEMADVLGHALNIKKNTKNLQEEISNEERIFENPIVGGENE